MTDSSRIAALFRTRNVAIVGASDRSAWSHSAFARFADYGHAGKLFAVNRGGKSAHGLPGYASVADIPEPVDTAFMIVPAAAVAGALRDAAEGGVRNAVVLSSGFAEAGSEGEALQEEIAAIASEFGVTMLGPNSLGFANFGDNSFCTSIRSRLPVRQGRLALVSQSGAVASELAKWAHAQAIGLSFFCATGNEVQVGIAEVVDYLVDDPATDAIAIYVEGITDPARFMQAAARAKEAAKPIVLLKIGQSALSEAIAQAHTGSLVGDDRVFDAMCRGYGISRVQSIEELITTADFLGKSGPIDPPRIGMASVSGGACGMYADLASSHGLEVPAWSQETQDALRGVLPDFAATLNPLDVTGIAIQNPNLWADIIPILAADPGIGAVVASYGMVNTEEEQAASGAAFEAMADGYARAGEIPRILSFAMQDVHPVQIAFRERVGMASVLPNLDVGVRALKHLQDWSEALRTPVVGPSVSSAPASRPVGEREVLAYLEGAGVPVIPSRLVTTADEAAEAARSMAGPLAFKIASPDIAHKTEIGGVQLEIEGEEEAAKSFAAILANAQRHAPQARIDGVIVSPMREPGVELIVGAVRDPVWGPAIVLGLGGVFTEALQDVQVRLLPVSPQEVRECSMACVAQSYCRAFVALLRPIWAVLRRWWRGLAMQHSRSDQLSRPLRSTRCASVGNRSSVSTGLRSMTERTAVRPIACLRHREQS